MSSAFLQQTLAVDETHVVGAPCAGYRVWAPPPRSLVQPVLWGGGWSGVPCFPQQTRAAATRKSGLSAVPLQKGLESFHLFFLLGNTHPVEGQRRLKTG